MMSLTRLAPKPGDVQTPAEFVGLMRRLLEWSGLTLDELEERARARGTLRPGEAVTDPALLSVLPSADATKTFLEVCGYVPEVQAEWLRARDRIASRTSAMYGGSPNREFAAAVPTALPGPAPGIVPDSVPTAGPDPVRTAGPDPVRTAGPDPVPSAGPDPDPSAGPERVPSVASDPAAYRPRHRRPRRRPYTRLLVAAPVLTTAAILAWSLWPSPDRPARKPAAGAPAAARSRPAAPPVDAVASGPAARWEFDGSAGSTVADSSGHRFTVTLQGRTTLTSAPGGSALTVDGAGHATTAGPVVHTDGAFTVTAWVRLDSVAEWETVVSQHDGRYDAFLLDYDKDAGRWAFMTPDKVTGKPLTMVRSMAAPQVGAWTQLAAVSDGAGQFRLYVDGRLEGTAGGPRIRRAAGPLDIGQALYEGGVTDALHGAVDEVSVFGRALSGEEIQQAVRARRG